MYIILITYNGLGGFLAIFDYVNNAWFEYSTHKINKFDAYMNNCAALSSKDVYQRMLVGSVELPQVQVWPPSFGVHWRNDHRRIQTHDLMNWESSVLTADPRRPAHSTPQTTGTGPFYTYFGVP